MNSPAEGFPIVVAEFEKNSRERVRIALDYYGGRHTIDIRCWYASGATWKPSRQGITTQIANLPALAEGLKAAVDRARDMGLIE